MTNTWQSFQTQLVALSGLRSVPVTIGHPGNRVTAERRTFACTQNEFRRACETQIVWLPGIRRSRMGVPVA